jgi:hypothetical protein
VRALRPLRIINQFDGVKDIFEVIFMAWRDLLRATALLLLVYFAFAIWAVNIFGGVPYTYTQRERERRTHIQTRR